jgi:exosortase E/protease (VPEID-CTERM system)
LLAFWRFYASGARSKDFTKIKLMMKLTRVSTGNIHSWLRRFNEHSFQLLGRLYIFAAIYTIESVSVIGALHIKSAFHPGLIPVAIVSFAVFLGLGYPWLKVQREELSFGFISFGGYVACVVVTIGLHMLTVMQGAGFRFSYAVAVAVSAIYLLKIPCLALACIPLCNWIRMFRATSPLWLYACLAGAAAWFLVQPSQNLWAAVGTDAGRTIQTATFNSARVVLQHVLPDLVTDAANFTVKTPGYSIEIAPSCSGMEGLGLILAFTSIWLWYLRKECRFPQALLLIPIGLVCIWGLNVVRLCILFLLGDWGYSEISEVGFHSQFGWIAFTAVALIFSVVTQKLSWVRRTSRSVTSTRSGEMQSAWLETADSVSLQQIEDGGESPAIRAYLLPFLAILAAAFISRAVSGNFEWAYPLRFIAAALVLKYFWPDLKKLNWRFGLAGPAVGVAVFLVWMIPSWIESLGWVHSQAISPLGAALAGLSPGARFTWIGFRVAAAVITVPIAEELAFRGYLARRLISREFESVSFSILTGFSICLSSVVFGMEHMKNLADWPHLALGTIAGLAFAAALRWRGRMGDAVAAHAVSNLLLAVWVLGFGDWTLW